MEALQGPRPGQKRCRDDYDSADQGLPAAKRRLCFFHRLLPPHPLVHYGLSTTSHSNSPGQSAGSKKGFNYKVQQLQHDPAQLPTDSCSRFPQFRMLPPELRRQIWRETWEHRNVKLVRRTKTVSDTYRHNPAGLETLGTLEFRSHHIHATLQHWNIKKHGSHRCLYSRDAFTRLAHDIIIHTRSTTRPPVSLWVNRESRDETLMHFKLAFALPGLCPYKQIRDKSPELSTMRTFVYFNFDLDILVFPLHNPLSTAFSQLDLSRLRRICIPELAPALPRFTNRIGFHDAVPQRLLPKIDDEDQVVRYGEFKYVWRLLRKWFPSLREIHLDMFSKCERYEVTCRRRENFRSGIRRTPGHPSCYSCGNIQFAIERNFPKLGQRDQYGPQHDIDCILEGHDIIQPVFKKQTLTIGKVKGERGKQDDNVTVTYWAIHDDDDHSNIVDFRRRGIDWASVRRQVVATTLEHALGPPSPGEYMVYDINPDIILRGDWDKGN